MEGILGVTADITEKRGNKGKHGMRKAGDGKVLSLTDQTI